MAFVATTDPDKARTFYGDVLGLKLVNEDAYAIAFDVKGIILRVARVPGFVPGKHTVLGWNVPDIARAVSDLTEAGVVFEHFPFVPDASGIWTAPSGAKIAWFKDPDGNTLSIAEIAK